MSKKNACPSTLKCLYKIKLQCNRSQNSAKLVLLNFAGVRTFIKHTVQICTREPWERVERRGCAASGALVLRRSSIRGARSNARGCKYACN